METEVTIGQNIGQEGFLRGSPPLEEKGGGTDDPGGVKPWTCANAQFKIMAPDRSSKNRRKQLVQMKEIAEVGINSTPYVEVLWANGTKTKALFDTGAQWSLVTKDLLTQQEQEEMEKSMLSGQGVTGSKIPVVGEIWRTVKLGQTVFKDQRFVVVEEMICPVILGIDLWSRVSHLSFNFENQTVSLGETGDCIQLWSHPFANEVALTEQDGDAVKHGESRAVLLEADTILPARTEQYVSCFCRGMENGKDYMIQPISQEDSLVSTPFGVIKGTGASQFQVRMSNLGSSEVRLDKEFCIATLEEDVWVTHPNSGQAFKNNSPQRKAGIDWSEMCAANLDTNKKKQLVELLEKNKDIFYAGGKLPLVRVGVEHTMNIHKGAPPTVCRPRRLSKELADEVKEHIEKLLKEGVIRESNSEWASPIVCARRSDGSLRLVIDYRLTNEKSRTATLHPIPLIDDLIDHLSGAKYFSTLDAKSGYHQMPLKREDSAATAFVVPWGHFEFADRCPFGLKGAGYSFQRMMSAVLGSSNFVEALCYLDDILIWGETWEIHIQRLKGVLVKVKKAGLALSPNKCQFGSTFVDYLGCRIGEGMISISQQRVAQLRRIERPKNVRALRSALGAFAYVQRWIPGLSELAKPLYDATAGKPYSRLKWSENMVWAFETIKSMIADAVALSIPNMNQSFVLVTDCSNIAAGAMLAQEDEGRTNQLKPCAFYHHTLSKSESAYSATEKELLAIVLAVKKFRVYLGKKFKLITDHQALRWLRSLNPENETGRRGRWLDLLQQFEMEIIAKKGKSPEMRIADFLSRVALTGSCTDDVPQKSLVMALEDADADEAKQFMDINELLEHQNKCPTIKSVKEAITNMTDLNVGGTDSQDWRKPSIPGDAFLYRLWNLKDRLKVDENGLLRLKFNGGRKTKDFPFGCKEKWRIVVPDSYKTNVLHMVHCSATAAHMGTNRCWTRARNNFWWPNMKADLDDFIRNCQACSKNKHVNKPNEAPSSFSTIPQGPLVEVMIDFVGPFQEARSHKFRYALQIQDVFSRFLIFEPTVDSTAPTAAEVLKNRWISIFGMPSTLRSDRGKHFTAEVFEELCKQSGIKHKLGSPEHPQSQGQVERQNQLLNQVRCLCDNNIERWPQALFSVQCSHNGATNSSTGLSPGRILFGKRFTNPEDILFEDPQDCSRWNKTVRARDEEDEDLVTEVTNRVKKSQEQRANSITSSGQPYKVGDRVRYKLNADIRSKSGGKIAPKYSEEYEVTEVLGDGFTYNLRAVDHRGRPKSRHFNLLKTVQRTEPGDQHGADGADVPNQPSSQQDEYAVNSSEDETLGRTAIDQPTTVRRSTRDRKQVQRLQADGNKKSYSSSKAVNLTDSE